MNITVDISLIIGVLVGIFGLVTFGLSMANRSEARGMKEGQKLGDIKLLKEEIVTVAKDVAVLKDKVQAGEVANGKIELQLSHISEIVERVEKKLDAHVNQHVGETA